MAPRVGFTLRTLRSLDPAACATDARVVWKDGERMNIGIVQPSQKDDGWDFYFVKNLYVCSPRELRLLGLQMIRHADNIERAGDEDEVVLP